MYKLHDFSYLFNKYIRPITENDIVEDAYRSSLRLSQIQDVIYDEFYRDIDPCIATAVTTAQSATNSIVKNPPNISSSVSFDELFNEGE